MGAVIGSSSMPTQCQAGRRVKANYTLLTFDNRGEEKKKLPQIRLVMKGLRSSLTLVIFLSKKKKELKAQLNLRAARRFKAEAMTIGEIWDKLKTCILQNPTLKKKNPFQ